MSLHVTLQRPLDGTPPTSQVDGKLTNFLITLFDVIGLKITSIDFNSQNGSKTIVRAKLPDKNPIEFLGPLALSSNSQMFCRPGFLAARSSDRPDRNRHSRQLHAGSAADFYRGVFA